MSIDDELDAIRKCGSITFSDWAGYAWKDELLKQRERVLKHLDEIITEAEPEHNASHMLERAFSLAAFCMRRLVECLLVTDRFRETPLDIHEIRRLPGAWPDQRDPFIRSTGGEIFKNFDMKMRTPAKWKPKNIADKFVHARFIAVHSGSTHLPDGLLVASDYQSKESLFHLTAGEYKDLLDCFLNDWISVESDWIDVETGKIHAKRE